MNLRTRWLGVFVFVTLLAAPPRGQEKPPDPADVSGRWTMSMEGHGAPMTLALTLKQEGRTLTGTWATPHSTEVSLQGEIVKRSLTLATTPGQEIEVSLAATLKDDGTLAGTLSSARGDSKWTARRAR